MASHCHSMLGGSSSKVCVLWCQPSWERHPLFCVFFRGTEWPGSPGRCCMTLWVYARYISGSRDSSIFSCSRNLQLVSTVAVPISFLPAAGEGPFSHISLMAVDIQCFQKDSAIYVSSFDNCQFSKVHWPIY